MKYLYMTAFLALLANEAAAQGPAFRPGPGGNSYMPNNGPAVSPYLNLNRSGASSAINYYGLVKPAFDTQASINNLQQQVGNLSGQQQGGVNDMSMVTGSSVRFLSTGNYFLSGIQPGNLSGRGGFGGGGMRPSNTSFNSNMPQNLTGSNIRYNPQQR